MIILCVEKNEIETIILWKTIVFTEFSVWVNYYFDTYICSVAPFILIFDSFSLQAS